MPIPQAGLRPGASLAPVRRSEVFLRFDQPVLPGSAALAQFNAEGVVVHPTTQASRYMATERRPSSRFSTFNRVTALFG